MKITPEDFDYLSCCIKAVDTPELRKSYVDANLTTRRYQWDLVRIAGQMSWVCSMLYPYLNDDHIQTALNRIIKPL